MLPVENGTYAKIKAEFDRLLAENLRLQGQNKRLIARFAGLLTAVEIAANDAENRTRSTTLLTRDVLTRQFERRATAQNAALGSVQT